jgi:hypothetical protein
VELCPHTEYRREEQSKNQRGVVMVGMPKIKFGSIFESPARRRAIEATRVSVMRRPAVDARQADVARLLAMEKRSDQEANEAFETYVANERSALSSNPTWIISSPGQKERRRQWL